MSGGCGAGKVITTVVRRSIPRTFQADAADPDSRCAAASASLEPAGRTSTASPSHASPGQPWAIAITSASDATSTTMNPPICSFVSANGPSVMPFLRTVFAVRGQSSSSPPAIRPAAPCSRNQARVASISASLSSAEPFSHASTCSVPWVVIRM